MLKLETVSLLFKGLYDVVGYRQIGEDYQFIDL